MLWILRFLYYRDNNLPILVFNLHEKGNIRRAVMGEKIGTVVGNQAISGGFKDDIQKMHAKLGESIEVQFNL